MEGFHSRGQYLCKSIGTKKIFDIRKEFNYQRTGLEHKHGRRFIVLEHRYGRCDVMWKRSIQSVLSLVLDIHVIDNWQLSKRYPLTSVTRMYRGLRYITHGGDVVFQLSADHQRAQVHFLKGGIQFAFCLRQKINFSRKTFLKTFLERSFLAFGLS